MAFREDFVAEYEPSSVSLPGNLDPFDRVSVLDSVDQKHCDANQEGCKPVTEEG